MLTTFTAALFLLAVLAIVNAALLWATALLLRIPKPRFVAALIIAAINPVAQILILVGLFVAYEQSPILTLTVAALGLVLALLIPLILIRKLFAAAWRKSLAIYVLWGIGGSLLNVAIAPAFRSYVLDTYYIPTSAMAPTVAGVHRLGTCPHCDGVMIVSTPLDDDGRPLTANKQGICSVCLKSADASQIGAEIILGDRIISNKLLGPKRWDIVTYYSPAAPDVLYTHRLVGMPGESVLVKKGQVWIDGVAQTPPPGLEKLTYAGTEEMESHAGSAYGLEWGVSERPCLLAADECFVLGDNTLRSSDSRFFGPVKMNRVTGVVTMCYWPRSRARTLRPAPSPAHP